MEESPLSTKDVPLLGLFGKLTALKRDWTEQHRLVSILHVGDSHVASDTMTAEIRRLLQREFGNGGRGYALAGKPWRSFRQEQMKNSMGGEWQRTVGLRKDAEGPFGLGGGRVTSSEPGAWIERRVAGVQGFSEATVTFLSHPEGGRLRILVDGKEHHVLDTRADESALIAVRLIVDAGKARLLRLEVVDNAPVTVMGIATWAAESGVVYHAVGLNGAEARTFLRFDETMTRAEVAALAPDLLVFTLGTNEAYNLNKEEILSPTLFEQQRDKLLQLIGRYRGAAPKADCLLLLPMDLAIKPADRSCYKRVRVKRRGRWRRSWRLNKELSPLEHPQCAWSTPQSLEIMRIAAMEAAKVAACAVWDQQYAMGGEGSIRRWAKMDPPLAGQDGVHLRLKGYRWLGNLLVNDLLSAFDNWKKTGRIELQTNYQMIPGSEKDVSH